MKTASVLFLACLWLITLAPDPAHGQCEDAQLTATSGATSDRLAGAVATDGTRAIMSAPGYVDTDSDPNRHGAVFIFELSGGTWTQFGGALSEPDTESSGIDYGRAVAIQGDHALVTAPTYDSATNAETGAVFYYHREGNPAAWVRKQTIVRDHVNLNLGQAIAINSDADFFVVGALGGETNQTFDHGVAYVYTRSGTTWSGRGGYFQGIDSRNADLFGQAVAIHDESVVVGAPSWPNGSGEGKVYGFSWNGSVYAEDFVRTGSGNFGDNFGSSVAMNAASLLVGEPGFNNENEGKVYPYEWNSGSGAWDDMTAITVSGSDRLGRNIGLAGAFAVLSSHAESSGEGVAYLIQLDTDATPPAWGTPVSFQASSPQTAANFSSDVAAGGSAIAIIGEPLRDLTGPNRIDAGAAYIFDLDCTPP